MIDVRSDSANLGDNLALTPLLAHAPCRLHLFEDPWVRGIAPIFEGLAAEVVWFTDRAAIRPPDYAPIMRPYSKRALAAQGFTDVPAIPIIRLTETELEEGCRVAAQWRNPCILKAGPQKVGERTVPADRMARLVAANPDVTFVQFGFSSSHLKGGVAYSPVPGVVDALDYPVRLEAAVYAAMGRYVGCDSGPYHLMLAAGGRADVLCPPHSATYHHWLVHYGRDCWLNLPPRVAYHPWDQAPRRSVTGIVLPS